MPDDAINPDDPRAPWGNEATWCKEHLCPLVVCDGLPHNEAEPQQTGVYNKRISRNPDGSDPLVREPKGKP